MILGSKRNFENDINRARNRSRDRNSLPVMKRCATQTETLPLAIYGSVSKERRDTHTRIDRGWSECCGQKVQCQMLPTSAINPNTNLLFPLTKEERIEIVHVIFPFWRNWSQISRVTLFESFLIFGMWISKESMPNIRSILDPPKWNHFLCRFFAILKSLPKITKYIYRLLYEIIIIIKIPEMSSSYHNDLLKNTTTKYYYIILRYVENRCSNWRGIGIQRRSKFSSMHRTRNACAVRKIIAFYALETEAKTMDDHCVRIPEMKLSSYREYSEKT